MSSLSSTPGLSPVIVKRGLADETFANIEPLSTWKILDKSLIYLIHLFNLFTLNKLIFFADKTFPSVEPLST